MAADMTRTCHLKCDVCGRCTHKHDTLEALKLDALGWEWSSAEGADYHVCRDCIRPAPGFSSFEAAAVNAPAPTLDWD